jgi:hypothetical protein
MHNGDMPSSPVREPRNRPKAPRLAGYRSVTIKARGATRFAEPEFNGGNDSAEPVAGKLLPRLALFGGAFLLLGVAAKVLSVSRMDLTVAQVLATQSSPSGIVFGALLLFFPAIALAGMSLTVLLLFREWLRASRGTFKLHRTERLLYASVAFGIFLTIGACLTPRIYFLGALSICLGAPIAGALIAAAIRAFRSGVSDEGRPSPRRRWQSGLRSFGLAFAAVYMIAASFLSLSIVLNDVVWLPPRQIALENGRGFVGYEVSRNETSVTLLRDADRKVEDVPLDTLRSAIPCRLPHLVNTAAPLLPLSSRGFTMTPACS